MAKARATRKRRTALKRSTTSVRRTAKPSTAARKTKNIAQPRRKPTQKAAASKPAASRAKRRPLARPRKSTSSLTTAARAVTRVVTNTVAAVAERTPWASHRTDAVELLETDHRRLEDLLKKGEDTTARGVKTRTALLATLTKELNAHELIEEKIFYPALKSHPQAKDIVLEGYQEHHVADLIVQELHGLSRSDERWGAKFKVLKENIEHHIEEEEGEMFKTARAVMSRDELEELGARMEAMKADALER